MNNRPCKKCGSDERTPSGNCGPCGRRNSREWRKANKERRRKYMREYSRENRAKLNARRRERYRSNPEIRRKQYKANKAYQQSKRAPGSFTPKQWEVLLDKYGHKCISCGRSDKEVTLSVDHIIPPQKGGTNHMDNLQPLCTSCNTAKSDNIIDYRPDNGGELHTQLRLID